MIDRLKKIVDKSMIRFIIVGGSATLIDYIIYRVLFNMMDPRISKALSMVVACTFSFVINKIWTFSVKEKYNFKMVMIYILTQIINIIVNTTVNYYVYKFTKHSLFAFLIATGVAMVVNYILQRLIVFKEEKK